MPIGIYQRNIKPLRDRFLNKVSIPYKKEDTCWEWKARISPFGYGQFAISPGNVQQAHRFSFGLFIGKIPKGKCVLHKCDNRKCVNPKHLWLGTQQDNIRDMIAKGRGKKATPDRNGGAKLDWNKVAQIRSLSKYKLQKDIAKEFNMSRWQVRRIIKGISWKSC